ncbi:5-formyltetrahydrofolate cyclo-ligase [Pseudoalteromonas luteoviolacea]|uniref:5-formyltetrahydrofolate cyclo-ligase n=1 Tax=Pseudoalteromonas luteoviolacea TaxID=43657 RepID=UPI001B379F25|nr:5-formyltetrahydrofolate cyclo-ligase [Pseudoalteromonas luteoviolacea]MBQ4813562.1 5-formyltetrahydrofolate cyclo-ligase [Pseudoalteromonas luteoviolacea]
MKKNSCYKSNKAHIRKEIRVEVRKLRNRLDEKFQTQAESDLSMNFTQHVKLPKNAAVGVYLPNDGEVRTNLLIQQLWKENHLVYLPVIHPFSGTHLLFQKYEKNSTMKENRYAILEPKLNCSEICPISQLDILLMPLVAFDDSGNRLGMGGGYYDRTLATYYEKSWSTPKLIGLAHDCQKVGELPIEAWDVPLPAILTPTKFYQWPSTHKD